MIFVTARSTADSRAQPSIIIITTTITMATIRAVNRRLFQRMVPISPSSSAAARLSGESSNCCNAVLARSCSSVSAASSPISPLLLAYSEQRQQRQQQRQQQQQRGVPLLQRQWRQQHLFSTLSLCAHGRRPNLGVLAAAGEIGSGVITAGAAAAAAAAVVARAAPRWAAGFAGAPTVSLPQQRQQTRGMKVRSSVKKLCDGCKVRFSCLFFVFLTFLLSLDSTFFFSSAIS